MKEPGVVQVEVKLNPEQWRKIEKLADRVEALEARLLALEGKSGFPADPVVPVRDLVVLPPEVP